jgi:co-chaperonin GroES (HSP10)
MPVIQQILYLIINFYFRVPNNFIIIELIISKYVNMKMSRIKPHNTHAVVEVTILPEEVNGVYVGPAKQGSKLDVEFYYGKAVSLGKNANSVEQCPELKKNSGVVFSQFAGYHVNTEDKFCKVVRGHDIVAILKDMENINKDTVEPTADRILVEIINEALVDADGIFNDSTRNPRELATQKGKVISCAKNADQFPVGTIVAFEPYVGNLIVSEPGNQLKTINSFDILFSVK